MENRKEITSQETVRSNETGEEINDSKIQEDSNTDENERYNLELVVSNESKEEYEDDLRHGLVNGEYDGMNADTIIASKYTDYETDLIHGIVNGEFDGTNQVNSLGSGDDLVHGIVNGEYNGISKNNAKEEEALNTYSDESLVQTDTRPGNIDEKGSGISVKGEHQVASLPGEVGDMELQEEKEKKEPHTLAWKIVKTMFLVLVWVCIGLCGEITGPTLLDLKLRTHSNYEDVSSGVSGRSAGFFVGSALGGVLVDKFGLFCELMVAFGLNGEAFSTAAIPWMPNTNLIFLMTFLQGTSEGVINIAGQKLILEMWMAKAAGPLHLLHGGFGIGSFIIPLVANPFLAVRETITENVTADGNVTLMPGVTMTTRLPTTTEKVVEDSRMEIAYFIAAAIAVLVSTVFLGYHIAGGDNRKHQKQKGKMVGAEESGTRVLSFKEMINPATCAGGRFVYGVSIFVFVFQYFLHCTGGERVSGKFIRAYSIEHLGFSKDDGTYINTVFWIVYAVGRVLGLLTARFIPIRVLVMLESGGCLLTSILLVIFGENSTALWILMPTLGFFIAPLFPSGIGWANYHVEMTGLAITFLLLGGSIGGIIYMRLTGYLFDHFGKKSFLYILLGFGIASFVTTTVMNIIGGKHGSRFEAKKEDNDATVNEKNDTNNYTQENEGFMPD